MERIAYKLHSKNKIEGGWTLMSFVVSGIVGAL